MTEAEVQVPVRVIQPVAGQELARQAPQKWPVNLLVLVIGGSIVLFISIALLYSERNYQETYNLALAHSQSTLGIFSLTSPDDPMPLYYAFIRFTASVMALSLQQLRLFSIACFVLILPLTYWVAVRATNDQRVGVLAAVLMAFSPFMVWYAGRGTMYALLALIVLANMYFYVGILHRQNRAWIGYLLTGLLGLAVHFFFAATLLTQLLFFLIDRRQFSKMSKYLLPISSVFFAAALGYWIYRSNLHSAIWHELPFTARPVATNVFIIFEQFLFGFQSVETITLVIALWPLLVILGLLAVQKYVQPNASVRYFIVAAVTPVIGMFALGWVLKPLFLSSYLIICLPPFILSVAWYLGTFEMPILVLARNVLLATMLVMLVIEFANMHRAVTGDYLGVTENATYQPAFVARPSAYAGHQVPAAGPPLHAPSDSPGVLTHNR